VLEKVVVPDSQDLEALRFEIAVTFHVARPTMLTTVDLNDQAPCRTKEVDDIMIDWYLSPELEPREALGTKDLP